MAREDLTKAYRSGKIGRRAFVRGLVALGMTVTAANFLADGAEAAPRTQKLHKDDVYGTRSRRRIPRRRSVRSTWKSRTSQLTVNRKRKR